MGLKQCAAAIRKNKSFLITTHTNPEGDALGSELALYWLLKKMKKTAVVMNEDACLYGYEFLPGLENIKRYKQSPKNINFDCMVVLDCSDLKRTGEVYKINSRAKPILNIDHHISNQNFGDTNWVEPFSSSTAEMVYKLYKELKVPLDTEAAVNLYTGILTDTGSFRYSNTTGLTHKIISELLKFGVDVTQVYKSLNENVPFADMKLLSKILPGMKRQAQGKIIWFQIRRNLLRGRKLSFDLSENILSFGRAVKGVEVVALFKENLGVKDEIRVNLRSQGKTDVNKIAAYFGGGGHKAASGITIHDKLDRARNKVLAKIRESLE